MSTSPNEYLVSLFNKGYDFAKLMPDGFTYRGMNEEVKASHELRCTKWNTPPRHIENVKQRLREEKLYKSRGEALSVLAVPLRRRPEPKQLSQKLKAPIAGEMPVFNKRGSLAGQRSVLNAMVLTHKQPVKMRKAIGKMSAEHCYRLYRVLRRAHQRALRRAARLKRRAMRNTPTVAK